MEDTREENTGMVDVTSSWEFPQALAPHFLWSLSSAPEVMLFSVFVFYASMVSRGLG